MNLKKKRRRSEPGTAGTLTDAAPPGENGKSRRVFLKRLGLVSVLSLVAGQAYTFLRSLIPNVSYESRLQAKLGPPDTIPEGATFVPDLKVYLFRDKETFHAISAVCTHLGCTVKYVALPQPKTVDVGGKAMQEGWEFHCPCHGSKYYGDGTNYAGPAPRPLDWVQVELASEDGSLVVDASRIVNKDFKLTV